MRMIDLTGKRFGRWTVMSRNYILVGGNAKWWCRCSCGKIGSVGSQKLKSGWSKSCGCLAVEATGDRARKHGFFGTSFYESWAGMKKRCLNKKSTFFRNYGGRGIKVCKRWMEFENFRDDMLPTYKEGLTIERIDNDGNYEPNNCRWATRNEQAVNKRNLKKYKGKCVAEWSRSTGIKCGTLRKRFKLGWSWEKALNTPLRGQR